MEAIRYKGFDITELFEVGYEPSITKSDVVIPALESDNIDVAEREEILREFSDIIGYDNLKHEMMQLCDIMRNMTEYEAIGANIPRGLFIFGVPGVGKTSMAEAVVRASGRPVVRLRKQAVGEKFLEDIRSAFDAAVKQAPSVLLMDDVHKFADTGESYGTPPEFTALQTCIDEIAEADVFIIATANSTEAIPVSLIRKGRFDRLRKINAPGLVDAEKILGHYMAGRMKLADDVDIKELAVMACGQSCAYIESLANDAGVVAGYEGSDEIRMEHFIKAYRRWRTNPTNNELTEAELERVACYRAGSAVMLSVLAPKGLIITDTHMCPEAYERRYLSEIPLDDEADRDKVMILVALAGRAAQELRFGNYDEQCINDLYNARDRVEDIICLGNDDYLEMEQLGFGRVSSRELLRLVGEAADEALQKYYDEALAIIRENRDFLDRLTEALMGAEYMMPADILSIQQELSADADTSISEGAATDTAAETSGIKTVAADAAAVKNSAA